MTRSLRIEARPAWWTESPNPPCFPGCRRQHHPSEFRAEGSLTCTLRTWFDDHGDVLLEVTSFQGAEYAPGVITQTPCEVTVRQPCDGLSAARARDLATALSQAVVLIGEVQ